MADISIVIDESSMVTITLDQWEWTGLTVNDVKINPQSGSNVQFQATVGSPMNFVATASQDILLVNPGQVMLLQVNDNQTGVALLSYESIQNQPPDAPQVVVSGYVFVLPFSYQGAQPSPILFSQGRMTGTFAAT